VLKTTKEDDSDFAKWLREEKNKEQNQYQGKSGQQGAAPLPPAPQPGPSEGVR
jgi:hypothetical protein